MIAPACESRWQEIFARVGRFTGPAQHDRVTARAASYRPRAPVAT